MFPLHPAVPRHNQEHFNQGSLTPSHTTAAYHNAFSQQSLPKQYAGSSEPLHEQHEHEMARWDVSGQYRLGTKLGFRGDTSLLHSSDRHATRPMLQKTLPVQGGYHHDPVTAFPQPGSSNSHKDLRFTPGPMKQDISFVRKLRQREKRHGKWRFPEQIHGKRSQDFMEEDSRPPCKQFISEEKMAARMGNLSITNDGLATLQDRWSQARQNAKRQMEEIESRLSDSESEEETNTSFKGQGPSQQFEFSQELKAALSRQEGAIPQSIVQSMLNPCTQLVLWKPPIVYLPDDIKSSCEKGQTSQVKTVPGLAASVNSTQDLNPPSESVEMDVKQTQSMPGTERLVGGRRDASDLFDCIDDEMDL